LPEAIFGSAAQQAFSEMRSSLRPETMAGVKKAVRETESARRPARLRGGETPYDWVRPFLLAGP